MADEQTVNIQMEKRGVDALLAHLKKTVNDGNINDDLGHAIVMVEDVATGRFQFSRRPGDRDLQHRYVRPPAGARLPLCTFRMNDGIVCGASPYAAVHVEDSEGTNAAS